ncbi:hypothetical protein GOC60_17085 [Sinorhizobium meliloti]|nr:hypothetical protein [Sinorhizobium meliloti]MDX0350179.1 hypothetical protein [Sinorhizobium meliloti]
MARVRFKRDFDWKPTSQVTIAYKAGYVGTVKAECAEDAVRAGAAVREEPATKASASDGADT